jgi:TonB-linked SusC/RagA family outer membrane protein
MKRKLLTTFAFVVMLFITAFAQEKVVEGTVLDGEGAPLPGVTVVVKGTSTGAVTDIDGKYKVSVPEGSTALLFKFVGFETQEVEIGSMSTIDVTMKQDATELDEIVVTAVGIEANKRALGYSVQNVGGDELVQSRETNIVNSLNSKVAGVTVVSSSGSPGASSNIRIRGSKSLNRSSAPLFVVDGVPIDNGGTAGGVDDVDFSNRAIDINPNDVASVTVLKGPAATVLYGIRASNGAIIITTKRGESGKAKIEYTSAVSMDRVNKLPEFQQEYAQGRPVGGVFTYRGPETGEGNTWGPHVSDLEYNGDTDYIYEPRYGKIVPKGTGNGQAVKTYNNAENFFKTAASTENNISVKGGNDQSNYYFSVGHLNQTGIVPNADFKRTSFRVNVSSKLTEKLTAGMQANYVNSGGNRIQRGSNISGVALGLFRTTPTFDNGLGKTGQEAADFRDAYQFLDGTQRGYRGGIYDNPYWVVNNNPFKDDVNRVMGNVSLAYEFLPWLTASYKLGLDHYTDRRNQAFDVNSASLPDGYVYQQFGMSTDINSDFLLMLNKDINEDITLNATVGHNYYHTRGETHATQGNTLGAPGFFHISNATDQLGFRTYSERKLMGAFIDTKLSYRDMIFFNFSGRNDWSSSLPEQNNSFFYPAVSLGWDFTETFGLANNEIFSYGKVRASWGQVGNDAPVYSTSPYFNSASTSGDGFISANSFPAYGVNAFERSTLLPNPDLKPETTETIEIGGEFKFLRGKIGVDVTYYNAVSKDLIITIPVPASTGYLSVVSNAGEISNKGIELVLTANPVKLSNGFNWDIDLNFTRNRNIVEKLPGGDLGLAGFTSVSSIAREGEFYGSILGNSWQRNDQGQKVIAANGWPLVDPTKQLIGNPNPDWVAGFRNTVSWKGLSLSALLDLRQGGDVWNGTIGILHNFGVTQLSAEQRNIRGFLFDGVTAEGNPNDVVVDFANPKDGIGAIKWQRYGFGEVAEDNVEDASWVRLRELTVSYNLPSSLFDKVFVSSASISLTARNLFLITEYSGIDPETNLTGSSNGIGLEYFGMPNTKSFGANLRVTF